MTDEPTVLDVLRNALGWTRSHGDPATTGTDWTAQQIADSLGIDPDMPFEQFARWLRYGKRLDRYWTYTWPNTAAPLDDFGKGWNACLGAIKGDDQ